MLTEPEVTERPAQPYVAIRSEVTMDTIAAVLPDLHGRVFQWLGERGIAPAGAPFWKYNVIDMARILVVDVAVPVADADAVTGDEEVLVGTVPSGRFATVRYTGHPSGLLDANEFLLKWGDDHNLTWDAHETPEGDQWAARLEIYETDPEAEPDMSKWITQLAFRLAD